MSMTELDRLKVVQAVCERRLKPGQAADRLAQFVRPFVRPFVKSNKNDAADAAAIWEAAQRPGMRFVAVKAEHQQAMLALHRMRQQLVRFRVMQVNQMRGLLYEFGVILPQGRRASIEAARAALATLADQLPAMLTESLQDQL
jgi:transposase